MSVFVLGVLVGVILGALGALAGSQILDELRPDAFASAPPAPPAVVKAVAKPPPAQTVHVPVGRPIVVGVFGDSLADGLWAGLYRELRDGKSYEVVRFSRVATGLSRYDYVNIHDQAETQLADRRIDIAVVMVGANDQQAIDTDGQISHFDDANWRRIYETRIDSLVALLRQKGAAVYWVGLPKMRRARFDARAQELNRIYQARAQALGVPFVPTVPVTVDGQGDYQDYLPVDGAARPRLMRAKDGVHMTMAGYLRIAAPVASLIRTDVARVQAAGQLHAQGAPAAGAGARAEVR